MTTIGVRARPSADRKSVALILTLGAGEDEPIQLQLSWESAKALSSELDSAAEFVREVTVGARPPRGG